ncbi:MAG: DUF2232 domain-containing protein [Limnochordales bacterium]
MLLALAGAFFMVPLLFLAPVPLAVLVYREGYRPGTVVAVATLVLVAFAQRSMFADVPAVVSDEALQSYSVATMIALVTLGLVGMVIGGAWREGASWWQAFWLAFAAAVLPGFAVWAGALLLQGVDVFAVSIEYLLEMMRGVVSEAQRGGADAETMRALQQAVADVELSFTLMRPLFPGLISAGALFGAFINTTFAGLALRRLGDAVPAFPPFARWRWPWTFALGFLAGHLLVFFGSGDGAAGVIGHNLLIVFNPLFAVQGAAVGWHWLRRGGLGRPLAVILLVAVYWLAPFVLTWIGALDTWLNFRRLPRESGDEGGAGNAGGGEAPPGAV